MTTGERLASRAPRRMALAQLPALASRGPLARW
jgi:hypothetical protein